MDIPVYLMTGFLEAGKTRFMQETLEDKGFFQKGQERTLVLMCEEGEEELDPTRFVSRNIFVETLDSYRQVNEEKLAALLRKHRANRVMIEYNGMWPIATLMQAMPEEWFVYQEILFVDASTIMVYNANMRALVVDKLNGADLVVFNRCEEDTDVQELHKLVRGVSRRAEIIYEAKDGSLARDNIEDPLPFDIEAPIVEIGDRDYALFYRDLLDEMDKYDGKFVKFLGLVSNNGKLPKGGFIVGRPIMTCCVEDITYSGLFCEDGAERVKDGQWVRITARVRVKQSRVYGRKGPVLQIVEVAEGQEPEDPVATFY